MDMSLSFFCKKHGRAVLVPSALGTELFHYNNKLTTLDNFPKLDGVEIMVFSVNTGSHWCLLIVNIPKKKVLWLDPNKSEKTNKKYSAIFLKKNCELIKF